MTEGHLYKLSRQDYRNNGSLVGGFLLGGDTVSVQVLGSKTEPDYQSDMIDMTNGTPLAVAGLHSFDILPEYICIAGTVTSIDILNYEAEDLGALAASE